MAPNIVEVTSIYGKTAVQSVTTNPTDIITNTSESGKVLKINSLIIANVDGVNSANISASVYRSSVEYFIAYTVAVPADSTILLITKDNCIYLEEGDSLRLTASANSDLQAVCSYEDIS